MNALDTAVFHAATGTSPYTVALMRILIEAQHEPEARAAIRSAIVRHRANGETEQVVRLSRLEALWRAHPQAWHVVRGTIASLAHDRTEVGASQMLDYWGSAFDRLAAESPEASVALYSLGDPGLLEAATREVVDLMNDWRLLAPDRDVVDLGCGIGRFLVALAPKVRSVLGLDLSARMVAEACRRCADWPRVRAQQSSGRNLADVADRSVDLVLAADVFPYLVQAGEELAAAHVREFARVLRPGGSALIFNWSYRGDLATDRADVAAAAAASAFDVEVDGLAPLSLWDGVAFLLRLSSPPRP